MDPRALASEQLRSGERLLWVGQSDPKKMFGFNDRYLVPFSILFCGFITTALVMSVRGGAQPLALAIPSALLVLGLYFLAGRFLVKRRRKRTEVYAVTNRRALVTTERATRETDVLRTDRLVDWTGDHVSVSWNDTADLDTVFPWGSSSVRQYANTGLDGVFGGRRDFAFYDVADGDALVSALDEASAH